jgi:Cu-Zn family superoxide dismutase
MQSVNTAHGGGGGGAEIRGREGSGLRGVARFTELAEGVKVEVDLIDAPPGRHAVHIHEEGDCSSEDFESAGAHMNPTESQHGSPDSPARHAGDLGNLTVRPDGTAHHELFVRGLTVADGPLSVEDRAIVIHEREDDFVSQPSGNAGARIACGVVERIDG